MQFPKEWNLVWWITPVCSWYVWIALRELRSQIWMTLSSQETKLVAVGENSQYLTQFWWPFKVYCSRRSTADHIFTSLSSPHEESRSPSQENPIDLILALWALMSVTSLALVSKSTYQNLRDSSLELETSIEPLGLNLTSWTWFYVKDGVLYAPWVYEGELDGWCPRGGSRYPCRLRRHTCRSGASRLTWLILCGL